MEALNDGHVGAVVRSVGGFVDTVDATIEIFGQIAQNLDFYTWKTLLEGTRDHVAARTHWSWMDLRLAWLRKISVRWNVPSPPHETRRVRFSFRAD